MNNKAVITEIIHPWRMVLIYNLYRIFCILALFVVYWFQLSDNPYSGVFLSFISAYLLFAVLCLDVGLKQSMKFETFILASGTIDIVVVILLINEIGYVESELGVLLYVFIAILSILMPGRIAVYFAALACCVLFGLNGVEYMYDLQRKENDFFSAGVYGVGFFATSLTAWYLSTLIKSREHLVEDRTKELANLHQLNEYIVERLQYGVLYVDQQQRVRVMNQAARHFLNASTRRVNQERLEQLSKPLYDKYLQFINKRAGDINSAQTTLEKPYLQVHFFSAKGAESAAVLIIIDDMAHIAQQAQQLKLASLGKFSASIAHEIRNPLGVISHASQLLGEDGRLSNEDARLKELIINNCLRVNQIVKNVLQISRGKQIIPESIQLVPFLKAFKREFCLINSCSIRLDVPRDEARHPTVLFDKSQLEQVLIILCDNARQHGRNAKDQSKIVLTVYDDKQSWVLTVCDDGPGIAKDIQDRVFEPFFTTMNHGNGMGLFIARDLCEMNQATIQLVDSQKGCCIRIQPRVEEITL